MYVRNRRCAYSEQEGIYIPLGGVYEVNVKIERFREHYSQVYDNLRPSGYVEKWQPGVLCKTLWDTSDLRS